MESDYVEENKYLILKITDEIDECTTQRLRIQLDREIQKYMPEKTIIDFSNVSFMDSAGIGLLIGRYKFANMLRRTSWGG